MSTVIGGTVKKRTLNRKRAVLLSDKERLAAMAVAVLAKRSLSVTAKGNEEDLKILAEQFVETHFFASGTSSSGSSVVLCHNDNDEGISDASCCSCDSFCSCLASLKPAGQQQTRQVSTKNPPTSLTHRKKRAEEFKQLLSYFEEDGHDEDSRKSDGSDRNLGLIYVPTNEANEAVDGEGAIWELSHGL
jgi:hypothetical protein